MKTTETLYFLYSYTALTKTVSILLMTILILITNLYYLQLTMYYN